MIDAIAKHLDAHQTGKQDWPADAVLAVKYNMSTWPCGWMREAHLEFFSSIELFEAWKAAKHHWAKCEDNYVAYIVYEWDLGPNERLDMSYDPGNVGRTYEEQNPHQTVNRAPCFLPQPRKT